MRKCIAILLFLIMVIGLSGCELEQRIPTDGVWYCAELQAQFTVFTATELLHHGGNDRGSIRVGILCSEESNPNYYYLCELICAFIFVSLSDTEYVFEDDDGKQYTFIRIGDTPKSQEKPAEG